MKISIFFTGIIISLLKISCGVLYSPGFKICVFAGDNLDIVTISGSIKKLSERMMFSVVINFEQLRSFVNKIPKNKAVIITTENFSADSLFDKKTDLYWRTISDLDFSEMSSSVFSSNYENQFCGSSFNIGIMTEEGICENMEGKDVFEKTDCRHYQIMEMMTQRLNVTEKVVELNDKTFPYVFPNGTHAGLFRMVSDQNVDVSCGSFIITRKRLDKYNFLWPTFTLESKIYLKREEKHDPWRNYLKPFEVDVWVAIIVYMGLSSLVRYFLSRFTLKKSNANLYHCILLSLQSFCGQGSEEVPNHFSIRLVHLLGLLIVVILFPVYAGSVISFLTVKIPLIPFYDFEGFVANPKYTLLTSEISFMMHYFYFDSKKEFADKRENLLVDFENVAKGPVEGLERLCHGKNLAYADLELTLSPLIPQLECEVIEVPEPILVQYLGMIVDENLPCRDSLDSGLLYLRSVGIIQRMQSKMDPADLTASNMILRSIESELRSISIADIYLCLVIYFSGLTLSLFILFLERFNRKLYWKRERHKIIRERISGKKTNKILLGFQL